MQLNSTSCTSFCAAEGVVAGLGRAQGVDVQLVEGAVQGLEEGDRLLGRLHGVLPEGELVELPDALPAVAAQRVEELERLDQVHGADHHVVVPARKLSLTSMREQLAVVDAQLGRIGRRLHPVQRVAEVEEHAEVVAAGRLDAEQRSGPRSGRSSCSGARAACTR